VEKIQFGDIFVHRKGKRPGKEAILYCHGSFKENSFGKAKVNPHMQLYFYSFHGSMSSDVPIDNLQKGLAPGPSGIVNFDMGDEVKQMFRMGRGKVASIAGPNSTVYDYRLTYNEKSKQRTDAMIREWNAGSQTHDLILIDLQKTGRTTQLSHVFKVIKDFKLGYEKLHFTCCRSPYGKDDLDTANPNAAKALVKLCG